MQKTITLLPVVLALALCVGAQEKPDSFLLHVTHVKSEYLGDKPTTHDCAKMPCTTTIFTVEARSERVDFVLECKQWVLAANPIQFGKYWELQATKDYTVRRDGRHILFFKDKKDQTDPFYEVVDETERKSK